MFLSPCEGYPDPLAVAIPKFEWDLSFPNTNPISISDPTFLFPCPTFEHAPAKVLHSMWWKIPQKELSDATFCLSLTLGLDLCKNLLTNFPLSTSGGASALSCSCLRIYLCMVGHAFQSEAATVCIRQHMFSSDLSILDISFPLSSSDHPLSFHTIFNLIPARKDRLPTLYQFQHLIQIVQTASGILLGPEKRLRQRYFQSYISTPRSSLIINVSLLAS